MYTSENCTLITGSRLVAQKEGTELRYIHQDHLSGTSLMTSANGTLLGIMKYDPFGTTRSGDVSTDRLFTGQRLDDIPTSTGPTAGLYYYNARYYDPELGRFISADTIIPNASNPQSFNRYSYCLNNPLKYIYPNGNEVAFTDSDIENIDYYIASGQYWMVVEIVGRIKALQRGWDTLTTAVPELTSYIEGVDQTVYYSFDSRMGDYGGTMPGDNGDITIWINPKYGSPTDLAQIEGHEGLHAAMQIQRYLDSDDALRKSNNYWLSPSPAREAFAGSFENHIASKLNVLPLRPLTADLAKLVQLPTQNGGVTNLYLRTTMAGLDMATQTGRVLDQMGYNINVDLWPRNLDLLIYLDYLKNVWQGINVY